VVKALLRRAEIAGGRVVDVRIEGSRVTQIDAAVTSQSGDDVVDCAGGALIPGLHDHHVHLLAFAAARASVDCSSSLDVLRSAGGSGWIRGVGYHESVAGHLDRRVLDLFVPDRPVRVQHRSGALWILNSAGLRQIEARLDASADVERDADGSPTGRLWRYDERLRVALPVVTPELGTVVQELHSYGITGVTDATPDLEPEAIDILQQATPSMERLMLLGAPDGHPAAGPRKLHLRDHDLPTFDQLLSLVARSRAAGRPVAVHCVTRASLVLTLAVLQELGPVRGDRVEHASVVPPELFAQLSKLGIAVVTQPSFLRLRGDFYLREVDPEDRDCLYPFASLTARGIPVAASSDAPYGDADPWQNIKDAAGRTTLAGRSLLRDERVPPSEALRGYLSSGDSPGGSPRTIHVGGPADMVLLDRPIEEVLREPSARRVRAVMARGRWVHGP
jgi:predicted amidohydrolase YtcJ